jgi:hypothetical protein
MKVPSPLLRKNSQGPILGLQVVADERSASSPRRNRTRPTSGSDGNSTAVSSVTSVKVPLPSFRQSLNPARVPASRHAGPRCRASVVVVVRLLDVQPARCLRGLPRPSLGEPAYVVSEIAQLPVRLRMTPHIERLSRRNRHDAAARDVVHGRQRAGDVGEPRQVGLGSETLGDEPRGRHPVEPLPRSGARFNAPTSSQVPERDGCSVNTAMHPVSGGKRCRAAVVGRMQDSA